MMGSVIAISSTRSGESIGSLLELQPGENSKNVGRDYWLRVKQNGYAIAQRIPV